VKKIFCHPSQQLLYIRRGRAAATPLLKGNIKEPLIGRAAATTPPCKGEYKRASKIKSHSKGD